MLTVSFVMLFGGVLPAGAESPAEEEVPCPEEMKCALLDTFTKADVTPEKNKYPIAVPRCRYELTIPLEKGKGAWPQVILDKEAPGR